MRLFIIHGDDNIQSYARLNAYLKSAKIKGFEIERISDKNKDIPEILKSEGLFNPKRLIVIENSDFILKKTAVWLKENQKTIKSDLLIYKNKEINQSFLKLLPKPEKIERFDIPKMIWKFLDSIYPGNSKNSLKLFNQVIENEPPELLLMLLARHFRDLIWIKYDLKSVTYPDWRILKLKSQTEKFKDWQLEEIIADLAKIDLDVKSSKATLTSSIDFLMISKLK